MKVDAVLNPAEIALLAERDLSETECVVFDVLRATSSMVTGLANGVEAIHPVRTIEEALLLKEKYPAAILGGERYGDRIDGFDIGNSPFEYQHLAGRLVITTTTNGTVALRACAAAKRVWVASLLNIHSASAAIAASRPAELLLVCAGTFADFALEDAYAGGVMIDLLRKLGAAADGDLTDSARALAAIQTSFPTALDALSAARNGRALIAKGRGDEVEWCSRCGVLNLCAEQKDGVVRSVKIPELEAAAS